MSLSWRISLANAAAPERLLERDADLDEFPLLNEPNVMLVALRASEGRAAGRDDCLRQLETSLRRAGLALPSELGPLHRRIETSYRYLHVARLVERRQDGRFIITPRGRKTLHAHPKGIDASVLVQFPEFRDFVRRPQVNDSREPRKEYEEGYIAGLTGRLITCNPYSADHIAHLEWENGWCEAQDELEEAQPNDIDYAST